MLYIKNKVFFKVFYYFGWCEIIIFEDKLWKRDIIVFLVNRLMCILGI